jgi:hypothetical protein
MRTNLLHPLTEKRPARRPRRSRGAQQPAVRVAAARTAAALADSAEQRVRDAGGPIDRASYSCACGLLFEAKVSTTVVCPHCGAGQAW